MNTFINFTPYFEYWTIGSNPRYLFKRKLFNSKLKQEDILKYLSGNILSKSNTNKSNISFSGIKTTRNRPYNPDYVLYAYNKLKHLPKELIAIALGTWIEESGVNPFAISSDKNFYGINLWSRDRYLMKEAISNPTKEQIYLELDKQIKYYLESVENTTDGKSWTHGGRGSGYNRGVDAYNQYKNPKSTLESMFRAHSFGYTRPSGKEDSYRNRLKVVLLVYNLIK